MSVIVKGIDMPENCIDCFVKDKICHSWKDCPLVELPEKHGRLIDGDYLYNRLKALGLKDENVFRIIKEEPTVIEREE